nr:hypothetical protein [Polynucleobacter sp. JS-Safj-400b-B2]
MSTHDQLQTDVEMVGCMNPEPNQKNTDGNRQNYQTRKAFLKPD